MRAKVLIGFCSSPIVHAVPGQIVELQNSFFREMAARGYVEQAPAEVEPESVVTPEAAASKSKSK
jgi:hypothetical protein